MNIMDESTFQHFMLPILFLDEYRRYLHI